MREQQKTEKQTRKPRLYLIIVSVILVLCLTVVIAGGLEYGGVLGGGADSLQIPQGAGSQAVAEALKESGAIHSATLFRIAAKFQGVDGQWQVGSYSLPAHSNYPEIFAALTEPATASLKVTIPEGKQVKQIARIYEAAGVCNAGDFLAACDQNKYDYDFLAAVTSRSDLEGYLMPDTYFFEPNTAPEVVINAMLANFGQQLYTETYIARSEELGYSFDEMLTLASIIESEAAKEEDRYTISGVFHNRLNNPAQYPNLQSCVTVEYAMGVKKTIISLADTKYDSPYNTYLYPGLPLGPICCPSEESLKAALYPASNDYYYFQSDKYGVIHFAATFQEHAAIQREVQADWQPDDNFSE